jgi:tRNA threonylcarbamoyladenosine biosynthesis protein TsaB
MPTSDRVALAIELSQRRGSLAIRLANGAVHEVEVPPASDDRDELMPALSALCEQYGVRGAQVGLVAVALGPGGFTGLRVAVATAKALALGVGARVVGVPSALGVASRAAAEAGLRDGVVAVALAAKGESAWLELVEVRDGQVVARRAGLHETVPTFDGAALLAADDHLPQAWRAAAEGAGVRVVRPVWSAAACLAQADRLPSEQGAPDVSSLEPIYPRAPEAVRLWDARRG